MSVGAVPHRSTRPQPAPRSRLVVGLGYLDAVMVLVAIAPAIALGAPTFGFAVGAGAWILQRIVQKVDTRWTQSVESPARRLTVTLAEGFARVWLLAIAIIIAGAVGSRTDGLTAAVVVMAAYSVAFIVKLITTPRRSTSA
jgi:hypothetical protein